MLIDLALARVLERAEANRIADYAGALTACGGDGRSMTVGGGIAVSLGATFPVNRGIGLGMDQALTGADLNALEAFFESRGCQASLEWCPLANASALALLQTRGYALEALLNTYVLLLEDYRPVPQTLDVQRLKDELVWSDLAARAFEASNEATRTLLTLGFRLPRAVTFGVFQGSQGLALGAVQLGSEVASLYGGGTVPTARGQGAQTALLHARLGLAQASGCRLATSFALAGTTSSRNFERLGFSLAYTKARVVQMKSGEA